MARYPVRGYRTAGARAYADPGFQSDPAPGYRPPTPANDNWRSGSVPPYRPRVPPGSARGAFRALAGLASGHPAIRAFMAAWRMYELAEQLQGEVYPFGQSGTQLQYPGFELVNSCNNNIPTLRHSTASPWQCLNGIVAPTALSSPMDAPYTIFDKQNGFSLLWEYRPDLPRWERVETYRPLLPANQLPNAPSEVPLPGGAVWNLPRPAINPMWDPMALPIGAPSPVAEPLPVEALPYRPVGWAQLDQSERGNFAPGDDREYLFPRQRPKKFQQPPAGPRRQAPKCRGDRCSVTAPSGA